jgi:uncharacterized protein (DUF433 family)
MLYYFEIAHRTRVLVLATRATAKPDVGEIAKMTVHDRIEINPKIMLGKPVIRGTRIPVELIVRKMAEGADEKALLQAYPTLTSQDIHAALRYAADSLAHEEVVLSVAG